MREDGKGGFCYAVEADLANENFIVEEATVELGWQWGAAWGRVAEGLLPAPTLLGPVRWPRAVITA